MQEDREAKARRKEREGRKNVRARKQVRNKVGKGYKEGGRRNEDKRSG